MVIRICNCTITELPGDKAEEIEDEMMISVGFFLTLGVRERQNDDFYDI